VVKYSSDEEKVALVIVRPSSGGQASQSKASELIAPAPATAQPTARVPEDVS